MQTILRNTLTKLTIAFLLVTAMYSGLTPAMAYAACSPDVSFDLYAKTGTATPYTGGPTLTIWGYSLTSGGSASLPGPVLHVNAGDCVGVTLYNPAVGGIPGSTSLLFQGQDTVPDTIGVSAGNSTTYTFVASNPGTFLYEAGLTANGQHQVAMGLYGALVVRPVDGFNIPITNQAYNSASTAFDTEEVVVLSEYDTALALNPTGFDIRNYKPKYFLINGKAYPGTAPISVAAAGDDVLLRYVNAGLTSHHMAILGLSQTLLGQDGDPFAFSRKVVSETIAPGQTLDALATIPASAQSGSQFALYDSNLLLRNNTGTSTYSGFGGMLTFLMVGAGSPPPNDTTGPMLSSVTLSPNPSDGSVSVALSATASEITTGNANVAVWEYSVDGVYTTVNIGSPTTVETLNATIPSGYLHGSHPVTVRAQDALGNWSATSLLNLVVDTMGPTTSGLSLTPNPSNGSVGVTLSFTANDSATGNHNINAAEYWIDPVGTPANGTGTFVSVTSPAPVKILNVGLPSGLSAGTHVISVHSQDALGNWGSSATINLVVDQTGPTTTGVTASPNPNNGLMAFNTTVQAVRVTASFSDVSSGGSNIAAAEGFIDTIGATGTGFAFSATDGLFNSSNENGYADIPLAVVNALSTGNHTIYVHAKDASGNWNNSLPYASTVLTINRSLYFSTAGNTNPPGTGGTADDADIYLYNGSAFSRSIDVSTAPYGIPSGANVDGFDRIDATHFYMSFNGSVTLTGPGTVQDEDVVYYNAGTWSLYFDGSANGIGGTDLDAINIVGSTLYFSTDDNDVMPGTSSPGDDADIYSWNGSFARVYDASALLWSTANVDGFVRVDANHFYLSYSVDTTVPGLGTVQDEDVVYFNNGTWIVYFDGTAKGLTNSNHDVDAFDIP